MTEADRSAEPKEAKNKASSELRVSLGVIRTSLAVIATISVFYVLSHAGFVAIPFLLAFVMTLLLYPLLRCLVDRGVPIVITVLLIIALLIGIFFPLGLFAASRLQDMVEVLPEYYDQLLTYHIRPLLTKYDIAAEMLDGMNLGGSIGPLVSGMTGFMLNWVSRMVMTFVFMFFMLLESHMVEDRLRRVFRGDNTENYIAMAKTAVRQISKYLRTLAVISLATGLLVWIALRTIGVDLAMTWGILAFFLNFVPTVGSILASVPPVIVALVQPSLDWKDVVLTAVSLLSIQFTVGNIITPKVMGDTLDLSPVVILISLMCWGTMWGFSGMLLSVPIAVMIQLLCKNIDGLRSISELLCSAKHKHDEG